MNTLELPSLAFVFIAVLAPSAWFVFVATSARERNFSQKLFALLLLQGLILLLTLIYPQQESVISTSSFALNGNETALITGWLLEMIYGIVVLINGLRREKNNSISRVTLSIMVAGGVLIALLNGLYLLYQPSGFYGTLEGAILAGGIISTLVSIYIYRKSEITSALRRTLIQSFLLALFVTHLGGAVVIATEFFIAQLGSSVIIQIIQFVTILTIAFLLSPLRIHIQEFTEHYFFREERANQESLRLLSERLLRSMDLVSVITSCVDTICERQSIPYAACYILQHGEENHLAVKQIVPLRHPNQNLPPLEDQSLVLDFLAKEKKIFVRRTLEGQLTHEADLISEHNEKNTSSEFIKEHTTKGAVLDLLKTLQSEAVVPLYGKDQLFALIFLAAKNDRRPFFATDISFIDTAATETITSIQRANYFEGDLQKTEFISIASHELRTPLTAIRGYLSMILDEKITGAELSDESLDQLKRANVFTHQLIEMVNDLLTLSRLESGKTEIEPMQLNILRLIKELAEKHKPEVIEKKIRIKFSNKRKVPDAWADSEGVKLILENLLSNAIKYNRFGGKVTIRINSHSAKGMLSINIQDQGIGMTREEMAHLFERFYRVASAETEGITGTGLGLNISRTYAQRMGGNITVLSRPGRGSHFTLHLPLFTPDLLKNQASTALSNDGVNEQGSDIPVGLLLLSPKRSGEPYTSGDLSLLEAVGHQTITAIQRAKLYEGDQMKTHFVSVASHELLTPISAIEGYVTLIQQTQEKKMAPKTAEFLANVSSSIHRLSSLVQDLLSVSRLESGKVSIQVQEFNIEKSIRDTVMQLEFVAKDQGIQLVVKPMPDNLPLAMADPERTTQVLMNLVGNAIKYNRPKGVATVSVGFTKTSGFITVEVEDTGIGMTKEEMAHLFEKFYRANSAETVGIIGTGLGLYITKTIVEKMGGQMKVDSKKGKGSTFSFTIPAAPPKK